MLSVFVLFKLYVCVLVLEVKSENVYRSMDNIIAFGPGLKPNLMSLPVQYFFIENINRRQEKIRVSNTYNIYLNGTSTFGSCRYKLQQFDRKDGTVLVRYQLIETCKNMVINILLNKRNVAESPYKIDGVVHPESCNCPLDLNKWFLINDCQTNYNQLNIDLIPFQSVNFTHLRERILEKFNKHGSVSLCNYVIKSNQIFRKCYGQHTGFKMFMDSVLLSIVRKVKLPDFEFFLNLGDWPLVKKGGASRTTGPYPIFSWCGSDDTFDIVLPTYDITESTLESMGRVSLDILSVQNCNKVWGEKTGMAFWRGRDSCRERLDLIDKARQHPDLINASITNFFFYRDEEEKYGPKVKHLSFMKFFDYKYQLNIDGTVAAYRLPYLLAGNSVVFKQESPFYEHFYRNLIPNKHYIPFKRDLSDLVEKIEWAKQNDQLAYNIMKNGQKFANENLLPKDIYCYHVQLFKEWSKVLVNGVSILPDMEQLKHPQSKCTCVQKLHEEL